MKKENNKISEETIKKITTYVQKNYKQYVGKKLIIESGEKCFYISDNKDGSPLILGKGIVN